ncbi:MAG: hypothetical protein WC010_02905 [Candidatus Absconditabacterales bacterium]
MNKKIVIILTIIVCALYAVGNANIMLNFLDINTQSFQDKFSLIHFTAPGNNFVGSIFRLPTKSVSPTHITLGVHSKICTKQIRGLYFNSQRGKRLRPLDEDTLTLLQQQNPSYSSLQMTGGLFTTCDSGSNYGIFGYIEYTRGGVVSQIAAGTRLNYNDNKIIAAMANSFQYFDNKVPVGYLYDSNGGIGYVGGELTGDEDLINYLNSGGSINSGFIYSGDTIISHNPNRTTIIESGNNAMGTMRNLIIQGSVGLSKSIDEKERLSLLGNFENKTVIYNGSDINSSTLINFAKQKGQQLCQGKELYLNTILGIDPANIICIENHDLTIDLNTTTYENKTIIVKNGNVLLQGGMNTTSPALDLFIDKGLLYLPNPFNTRQGFDDQGFPVNNGVTSGMFLKGNFIINGLMLGEGVTAFDHKLHLQGKITTLNTPLTPNQSRIDQIEELLGTTTYESFINLQKVFTRTCGFTGSGSDGTSCTTGGIISTTPLVILNGNYPSNIVQ